MLSDLDRRVIRKILFGGFNTFTALSKDLRVSQGTLLYSLRKLNQMGILQGYRIRINPMAVGYKYPVLFMIRPKTAKHSEFFRDEFLRFPWMHGVSIITGGVDLVAFTYFSDYLEMGKAIDQILSEYGDKIYHISTIPIIGINKLHQVPVFRRIPLDMDEWDFKILHRLYLNPLETMSSIAEGLGKSRNFVARRVRRFYDEQVILKKSARIDLSVLPDVGISCWAMVFLDVSPSNRNAVITELVGFDSIHELFSLGTTHDFLAIMRARNIQELARFLRYLLDRDLVIQTVTNVVLSFKEKEVGDRLFSGFSS